MMTFPFGFEPLMPVGQNNKTEYPWYSVLLLDNTYSFNKSEVIVKFCVPPAYIYILLNAYNEPCILGQMRPSRRIDKHMFL